MKKFVYLLAILALAGSVSWAQDATITEVEYFFDTDPGVGVATGLTITNGTTVSDIFSINSTGLSLGFHTLWVRAKNTQTAINRAITSAIPPVLQSDSTFNANWGMPESRLIFVDGSGGGIILVDEIEYFFDTDPGYGLGTKITDTNPFTPANIVNIVEPLDAAALTLGFHDLFIRARGEGGDWGMPENRLVFINSSGAGTDIEINDFEYFFDTDPGYGAATGFTVTPGHVIDIMQSLDASGLSIGFHTLFVRAQAGTEWGMPESRLVFVDQSGGGIVLVDQLEYFFDTDPGYGLAATIVVTPGQDINLIESLKTDTLSFGFHTLFLRARGEGGKWGMPESRLMFVDVSGGEFVQIDRIEYFIDDDPGFGLGLAVPFPAADNFAIELGVAPGAIIPGFHLFTIRARDVNGKWGIGETQEFYMYPPSSELDSMALKQLYEATDGDNWTNSNNWFSGFLVSWYGVTVNVATGRVEEVDLSSNNLVGKIPFEATFITDLSNLDLTDNLLQDTVPSEIIDLVFLDTLHLGNNQFSGMPDVSSLSSLVSLQLDTNFFDFGDLSPNAGVTNYEYLGQGLVDNGADSTVKVGQAFTINSVVDGGLDNIYQWYLNGDTIAGANGASFILPQYTPVDTGTYHATIGNLILTDLILSTGNYNTRISDFEEDSLALVSFYMSTDGANWTSATNWLTGNLDTWEGVTVENGRVTSLVLEDNGLTGEIPLNFNYADSILVIDLSGNAIEGELPDNIIDLVYLTTLDLSFNDFVSIPDLNTLNLTLTVLDVEENHLQFGDLERNAGLLTNYIPQDSIFIVADTLFEATTQAIVVPEVEGSNNRYRWIKDDVYFTILSLDPTLTLPNVDFADEGKYRLEISNAILSGLILETNVMNVGIASLQRDSTALVNLFNSTNDGALPWEESLNWNTPDISQWFGVTVSQDPARVTSVVLPNNNLDGVITDKIRDITKLELLDVSGNKITSIPFLASMQELDVVDVSSNELTFADLEPNIAGFATFDYLDQAKITAVFDTEIPQGTDINFGFTTSGRANSYQWYYNDIPLANNAFSDSYSITSIEKETMGTYYCVVESSLVPNLDLVTENYNVLATANINGTLFNAVGVPASEGFMNLFKVNPQGKYDTLEFTNGVQVPKDQGEKNVPVASDGSYVLSSVILDDYLLAGNPLGATIEGLIPSYFGDDVVFWDEADTLKVVQNIPIADVLLVAEPPDEAGPGVVLGFLEEEDGLPGRVKKRKRVSRAKCALRRAVAQDRSKEDGYDLIAIQYSDDQGQFNFGSMSEGEYNIRIDYPGLYMDQTTEVNFTVRAGEVVDLIASAFPDESLIKVDNVSVAGIFDEELQELRIYPNPTTQRLFIEAGKLRSYQIIITDLAGRVVMQSKNDIEEGNIEVDVSRLKGGLYLVKLVDEDEIQTTRVATLMVKK